MDIFRLIIGQKIFSGETTAPRYTTLLALEKLFTEESKCDFLVREEALNYCAKKQGKYTGRLPILFFIDLIDGNLLISPRKCL